MRIATFAFLAVIATVAFGASRIRGVVSGTSPQIYTATANSKLRAQCVGQIVTYRPMNATEVHDGGLNDERMDFIANPDAFPIVLNGVWSRVDFRNIDGGTVSCGVLDVSP